MLTQNLVYIVPILLAAGTSLSVAVYIWQQRSAVVAPAVLLMVSVAVWTLAYALEIGSTDLANKIFWGKVKYLGVVAVPSIDMVPKIVVDLGFGKVFTPLPESVIS